VLVAGAFRTAYAHSQQSPLSSARHLISHAPSTTTDTSQNQPTSSGGGPEVRPAAHVDELSAAAADRRPRQRQQLRDTAAAADTDQQQQQYHQHQSRDQRDVNVNTSFLYYYYYWYSAI